MGADFIFAVGKKVEHPDKLKAQVPLLTDDTLRDVGSIVFGNDDMDDEDLQHIRDVLTDAIDIAADTYQRRDTGLFVCDHGTRYVVSGGVSWGDDPTEACQYLWALETSGLEERAEDG